MAAKAIRIYTQQWTADEYFAAVELGDVPAPSDTTGELYVIADHADDFGDWNDDETIWLPASDVETAVLLLTGHATRFYAATCSETVPQVSTRAWYQDQPYENPYTGEHTERSAHLEGPWSDEEATAIHARVHAR